MELSGDWSNFVNAEFDVFLVTPLEMAIYMGIAILCRLVVPASGPVLLKGGYFKNIEQYGYDDNGVENIVFRILAPIFASYFFLAFAFMLGNAISSSWIPSVRWMPVMLYWIIYTVIATAKHGASCPVWTLAVQAITSCATAIYFDWIVVCKIPGEGPSAFDQSNIGWQVLTISFFAIGAFVAFGVRKKISRYNSKLLSAYRAKTLSTYKRN